MKDKSIVLVGMMGAGKTTIGKNLAKSLGFRFVDIDAEIVKAKRKTIPDIFETEGEEEFRKIEKELIAEYVKLQSYVIASGGGAFAQDETRGIIKKNAISIWLDADIDTIFNRVKDDTNRPLLNGKKPQVKKETLRQLLQTRKGKYEQADFTVKIGANTTITNVIADIHSQLSQIVLRSVIIGGEGITYSWSPFIHNFWFRKYNVNGRYDYMPVAEGGFTGLLDVMKKNGFRGANIGMPHKQVAYAGLSQEEKEHNKSIGAVNTIVFGNKDIHGGNTDSYGYIQSIKQNSDENVRKFEFEGATVVVLGAGGGARGVCHGLLQEGVGKIYIANRNREHADKLRDDLSPKRIEVVNWDARNDILSNANLLINTTSLGMDGHPRLELSLDKLPKKAIVSDIVYKPVETELLKRAKAKDYAIVDGLDMLLHQAAPGFATWFGVWPEVTKELKDYVLRVTGKGTARQEEKMVTPMVVKYDAVNRSLTEKLVILGK